MAKKIEAKDIESLEKAALQGIKAALKKSKKTKEKDLILSAVNSGLKKGGKTVRPDVVAIRKKLEMTQKEFAEAFHLNLETLRNWEQGERSLDTTAIAYLTCIERQPKAIERALNSAG